MSKTNPTLVRPGEYLPPQQVEFAGIEKDGLYAGTYAVELGAEYKDLTSYSSRNARRRYARVNGHAFNFYAMIHEEPVAGRRIPDRRILRDEAELNQRAVEWYVYRVLEPLRKEAEREEQRRQRVLAMESTDNWGLVIGDTEAVIEPIGISISLSHTSDKDDHRFGEERERRTAILQRLLDLVKIHGLTA